MKAKLLKIFLVITLEVMPEIKFLNYHKVSIKMVEVMGKIHF